MADEVVQEDVIAEVEVLCRAERGCYVRTYASTHGSVTFSLHPNVWKENGNPSEGELVVLSELRYLKNKGWRAECARRPTVEAIRVYLGEKS